MAVLIWTSLLCSWRFYRENHSDATIEALLRRTGIGGYNRGLFERIVQDTALE
jgi:hypothetical protein